MFYLFLSEAILFATLLWVGRYNFAMLLAVPVVVFNIAYLFDNAKIQLGMLLIIITFFVPYAITLLRQFAEKYADRNYEYSRTEFTNGFVTSRFRKRGA